MDAVSRATALDQANQASGYRLVILRDAEQLKVKGHIFAQVRNHCMELAMASRRFGMCNSRRLLAKTLKVIVNLYSLILMMRKNVRKRDL